MCNARTDITINIEHRSMVSRMETTEVRDSKFIRQSLSLELPLPRAINSFLINIKLCGIALGVGLRPRRMGDLIAVSLIGTIGY